LIDSFINVLFSLPLSSAFSEYLSVWKIDNNAVSNRLAKVINQHSISPNDLRVVFAVKLFILRIVLLQTPIRFITVDVEILVIRGRVDD